MNMNTERIVSKSCDENFSIALFLAYSAVTQHLVGISFPFISSFVSSSFILSFPFPIQMIIQMIRFGLLFKLFYNKIIVLLFIGYIFIYINF